MSRPGLASEAKVKRSASVPKAGMPSGNSFLVFLAMLSACFGFIRPVVRFSTSASMPMPSIRSIGSSTLPLDFDIFLAFAVADQAMHIDVLERNLAGDVLGHHDHAGDPEEDDVEAGDQHGRRQVLLQTGFGVGGLVAGPVQVENGHRAEEYQVSSTSSSRVSWPA